MVQKSFVLVGAPASTAQEIEIDLQNTFEYLQWNVAQHFSIAEPSGEIAPRLNRLATLTATRHIIPNGQIGQTR